MSMYAELSRRQSPKRAALNRLLTELFNKARRTGEPVVHHAAEPLELTRGQVIACNNNNCIIYMEDERGTYYLDVEDNMKVVRRYVNGTAKESSGVN